MNEAPPKSIQGSALVTGAGKRIGRAIAIHLGGLGWPVAVHYNRTSDAAAEVAGQINAAGGKATAVHADLADDTARGSLIQRCTDALGPVTCLINNASIFEHDTLATMSAESWQRHQTINLYAPLCLAQDMAAGQSADATGNIVNIIDQRVWRLTPNFFSYTLSKSALWTATRTMAQDLAPRIRVNAIGPGPTLKSDHQSVADFNRQVDGVLMKQATGPAEIARAVAFIIATPSLTGQMLALDGGQHLVWETPDVTGVVE